MEFASSDRRSVDLDSYGVVWRLWLSRTQSGSKTLVPGVRQLRWELTVKWPS